MSAVAFQVDEGGRVPLLAHHHFTAEYDTAAKEDLRVTVVTLPVYGYIENTRTGKLLGSLFFLLAGLCSSQDHICHIPCRGSLVLHLKVQLPHCPL